MHLINALINALINILINILINVLINALMYVLMCSLNFTFVVFSCHLLILLRNSDLCF
jgi:hypothetical protein